MRKTKQKSWIDNSDLGSLNFQKTIFTGLGSLDFSTKSFAGLGSLNQAFDRLWKKNLQRRLPSFNIREKNGSNTLSMKLKSFFINSNLLFSCSTLFPYLGNLGKIPFICFNNYLLHQRWFDFGKRNLFFFHKTFHSIQDFKNSDPTSKISFANKITIITFLAGKVASKTSSCLSNCSRLSKPTAGTLWLV